jgi:hypothetical protein
MQGSGLHKIIKTFDEDYVWIDLALHLLIENYNIMEKR